MADGNFRDAVLRGRTIRTTDFLPAVAYDPGSADLKAQGRADTLAEVIRTIFRNPPGNLTAAEQLAVRNALSILLGVAIPSAVAHDNVNGITLTLGGRTFSELPAAGYVIAFTMPDVSGSDAGDPVQIRVPRSGGGGTHWSQRLTRQQGGNMTWAQAQAATGRTFLITFSGAQWIALSGEDAVGAAGMADGVLTAVGRVGTTLSFSRSVGGDIDLNLAGLLAAYASNLALAALAVRVSALEAFHAIGDHTRYAAIGPDAVFTAQDFLAGSDSQTNVIVIANSDDPQFIAFAIPADQADLLGIMQTGNPFNARGQFTPAVGAADMITIINGVNHKVYVTAQAYPAELLGGSWTLM